MSYYSNVGRDLDTRDSCALRSSEFRRKGPGQQPKCTLGIVDFATDSACGPLPRHEGKAQFKAPPSRDDEDVNAIRCENGAYRRWGNHAQNAETQYQSLPRKMAVSRINEGNDIMSTAPPPAPPSCRVKAAENYRSRINEGNDIFGPAVSDFKTPPPPTTTYLSEKLNRSAVKSPWLGFTDVADKTYIKR